MKGFLSFLLIILFVFTACKKKTSDPEPDPAPTITTTTTNTTSSTTTITIPAIITSTTNNLLSFEVNGNLTQISYPSDSNFCMTTKTVITDGAFHDYVSFNTIFQNNSIPYLSITETDNMTGYGEGNRFSILKNIYCIGAHRFQDSKFVLNFYNLNNGNYISYGSRNYNYNWNNNNFNQNYFAITDTLSYTNNNQTQIFKVKANFKCWLYKYQNNIATDSIYLNNGNAIFTVCN